mmetsp:Transcript_12623/g.25866  ORF Transcript_12623/g.25866 Transcript_12623/m.25866 type:complete len:278 (-) Transcript_12623:171-1004(-)
MKIMITKNRQIHHPSFKSRTREILLHSKFVFPLALPFLHYAISTTTTTTAKALNLALISGSTRTTGPPTVLGPRVSSFILHSLQIRGHTVTHIDPKNHDFPLLEKPHFAYPPGRTPENLQRVHEILNNADGYVCVTPEYNHSPSPALINILNHFGSSVFSFKPSAIVSYSAGQWGGTRAAVGLRTTLSELGCLPVSAMIHIPKAQDVFDKDGNIIVLEANEDGGDDGNNVESAENAENQWQKYCGRCFSQLEWWADAAKRHKEFVDPFDDSGQRNAP